MPHKILWRSTRVVTLFSLVLAVVLLMLVQGGAQTPAGGAGRNVQAPGEPPVRIFLFENDRVRIDRLQFASGRRTDPPGRTHPESVPQDVIIIALTPGEVEVSSTGEPAVTSHVQPGKTWWWSKPPATHSIANVGTTSFHFVQVRLKESGDKVQWDGRLTTRPGIVPLVENGRVFVEKLTFPPGRRTDPPGQSHPEGVPRDVIIMALTPGNYEISSAGEPEESGRFQPGKIWWWPKPPSTHSIANVGKEPYDFVKISLK